MPEWRVKVEQKEYEEVLAERCQLAVERIREIGGTIEAAAKSHGKSSSGNGHWIYPGTVLSIPA